MKLLLPIALLASLASCTSLKNNPRPSAELPCRGAPATNQGLAYVSGGVGQGVTSTLDVTDDSLNYGGKVVDRQARDYTNIGMNAVRRTDDIAYREVNRYADYGMDTVDDGAVYGARAITRWPGVATGMMKRGLFSTRRVYQATMNTYGETVNRGYFGFWNIFNPPEPKPYMVGSLNDLHNAYAMPGSSWHCRLPQLPVEPEPEVTAGKNPVTYSK
ncbi:hypothetical protein [Prosthecobacter sp.]|uniref:hypothetical protein n=1 Tax=Prosthecobacter sp. TaxID=1965333 RepID=UPI001E0EC632|nr:hypothetical protein [Prosthecobacter sp.]MCB1276700.1 hypothetical protein [Prosthecobacter sp.]